MPWEPPSGRDPGEVVEQLARDILAVFTEAEARLLADLARRARTDGKVPAWAAEKAAAVREVRLVVERMITQLRADADAAASDAVLAAWQAGSGAALAQLAELGALDDAQLARLRNVIPGMDAAALLAGDLTSRLDALHLRILRWAQDAYQTAVAAAAPAQLLGTGTTRSAQRSAWDRLVSQGVTGFVDRSGRGWNLASYVEMATRTATARTWNEGHLARLDSLGVDLVTVSNTTDGCALCAVWQGRILARTGSAGERTVENELTGEPMTITVAGTVDEARAAGLMHPNCRHTFLPFIPGVTRAEPVEHDQAAEDEREHLRHLERQVRKEKRKEAGALTPADADRARRTIRALQAEIRDHIAATGLNRKRYREQLNLGHGDQLAARRRRDELAGQVAEGTAEQARLDAVTAEQARRREQERLAAEKAERDRYAAELRELSDADLETRFAEVADDETLLDLVLAEMDRRQAEEQLAAERRERDQQRREQQRQEREKTQWQRFEELTGQGWSEEDAVAEAFGISVEQQRRDRAIARLRELGYTGRGLDELARKAFRDHVYEQYIAAEDATRGHMLTPQGQAAGIDPHDLFTGPASRARKWASDELKEWWDEHGRITYDGWVARLLGDDPGFQGTTGDSWLQ
jgi:minor capsid protein 2